MTNSRDRGRHTLASTLCLDWRDLYLEALPSAGIGEGRNWGLILAALVSVATWRPVAAAPLVSVAACWPVAAATAAALIIVA